MRLPDFMIIGAAKAGTTSLHAMLEKHPDVFMSQPKEPEFFARDECFDSGLTSYAQLFVGAGSNQVAGEASTLYSLSPFFPEAPSRIAHYLPEVKLIYVMRHPVERSYSYYLQLIKGYQNATKAYAIPGRFEDFIADKGSTKIRRQVLSFQNSHLPDDPELCLAGSNYVMQIEAYLDHLPREQFLFLSFESFRRDPQSTFADITDFLGLNPMPQEALRLTSARNVSADHFDEVGRRFYVDEFRQRIGPFWSLRRFLPDGARHSLRKVVTNRFGKIVQEPPPMLEETRYALSRRFARQLPRLKELTGLGFEEWDISDDVVQ